VQPLEMRLRFEVGILFETDCRHFVELRLLCCIRHQTVDADPSGVIDPQTVGDGILSTADIGSWMERCMDCFSAGALTGRRRHRDKHAAEFVQTRRSLGARV
jgi:hypothetical protein